MSEALKILAVDLSLLFRRNWEVDGGRDLGAAFKRTVEIVTTLREGFDRVAIAVDSGRSFRTTIEPSYKAGRENPGSAYFEQQRRTADRLRQDGCHVFGAPMFDGSDPASYYEADDVIASIVKWASSGGHRVRIVSGDKDLLACVNDELGIDVQRPDLDGYPVLNSEAVRAKLKVPPSQVADLLALGGDLCDGYKAFPGWEEDDGAGGKVKKSGIGEGTAATLLALFKNCAGVFQALTEKGPDGVPKIKGHVAAVLNRHGFAAAEKGLALATLRTDVPLNFATLIEPAPVEKVAPPEKRFATEPEAIEGEPVQAKPTTAEHDPVIGPSKPLARVPFEPLALQPRDLPQLETMAMIAFNSRCYTQFSNYEQVMMCMAEARERGIPMGTALRSAYIVKGKLAWSASFLAGLVLSSGKADYFEITETTSARAVVSYKRKGRPEGQFPFTIEEAKAAGWVKSGDKGDSKWVTNPRTMLRWAAIREAARAFFPDVVSGMYTPDELRNGEVLEAEWDDAA